MCIVSFFFGVFISMVLWDYLQERLEKREQKNRKKIIEDKLPIINYDD